MHGLLHILRVLLLSLIYYYNSGDQLTTCCTTLAAHLKTVMTLTVMLPWT